jgi:SAM-dependent methyltransferase
LVCAFDVIEHVEDHKKGVEEMKRVCKTNGVNLITVPAFMSHWGEHDEVNHHFRRYRLFEIKNLYKDAVGNGSELFSTYFNFYLFLPILFFRKISNLLKGILKRKGSGSDFGAFNPGLANTLLFNLMYSENLFLKNKIKLPFGVSILYSWKKNAD